MTHQPRWWQLLIVLTLLLSGCSKAVYTRLSEPEVNEMIAVLASAHIEASRAPGEENTWQLEVGSAQYAQAVALLREYGLPTPRFVNTGEVFKKEGLVSTPSEERIRFKFALEQELQNTLSRIDGVVAARVHIVVPYNDPLADKLKPSSASVFIKHRRDVNLGALVPQIKELVARSIEGLGHDNVSLSMFASQGLPTMEAPPPGDALLRWGGAALALLVIAAGALLVWRRRAASLSRAAAGSAEPARVAA